MKPSRAALQQLARKASAPTGVSMMKMDFGTGMQKEANVFGEALDLVPINEVSLDDNVLQTMQKGRDRKRSKRVQRMEAYVLSVSYHMRHMQSMTGHCTRYRCVLKDLRTEEEKMCYFDVRDADIEAEDPAQMAENHDGMSLKRGDYIRALVHGSDIRHKAHLDGHEIMAIKLRENVRKELTSAVLRSAMYDNLKPADAASVLSYAIDFMTGKHSDYRLAAA